MDNSADDSASHVISFGNSIEPSGPTKEVEYSVGQITEDDEFETVPEEVTMHPQTVNALPGTTLSALTIKLDCCRVVLVGRGHRKLSRKYSSISL